MAEKEKKKKNAQSPLNSPQHDMRMESFDLGLWSGNDWTALREGLADPKNND